VRITSRITGRISAENTTMKQVSEEAGFKVHADSSGESLAEINL
jgi:hypothetical protein